MLYLEILAPEEVIYKGDGLSITVPNYKYNYTVLKGHASFIGQVSPGILSFINNTGEIVSLAVDGGFIEVKQDKILVLIEQFASVHDINKEEEEIKLAEALNISASSEYDINTKFCIIDYHRAKISLFNTSIEEGIIP